MEKTEKELTLSDIHEVTLGVLDKIIEICENNNIDYFVIYGSLIGAVRHKGFIPWDDDLDIGMLRSEFDRFCDYCYQHEDEMYPYKLMDKNNTSGYPFNIPRICDLRYEMETDLFPDIGMGVFVDIYPFDGMGNAKPKSIRLLKIKKILYMSGLDYINRGHFVPSKKNILFSIIRYGIYLYSKTKSRDYFLKKFSALSDAFPDIENSRYAGCVQWGTPAPYFPKEWLSNTIYGEFEKRKVKIPVEYDKVLKKIYGNYMELPPEEKRIPHHEYKIYTKN